MARVLGLLLWLATACGAEAVGGAVRRAPAPARKGQAPAPAADPVLELVRELPEGADRCVVVRPQLAPGGRRALIARVSQAEPLAFLPELAIEGYASASRERRDGAAALVTLLRVQGEEARVREVLSERLSLRWDDVACDETECPLRARFVSAEVVRIERGDFGPATRGGVTNHCLRMAQHGPQLLELSVARTRGLDLFGMGSLPLRSSTEVRADASGVRVSRFELMRGSVEAQQALEDGPLRDPLAGLGGDLRRYRQDAAVHTELALSWQDLELARADDARVEAAARDAERWMQAQPDTAEPPAEREDVLAELGYRLELIERAQGDARVQAAQGARRLLEGALGRDPDDEGLSRLLAELLLAELREVEPARGLIARFARRPSASKDWARLARHAAALTSPDVLAEALVRDRLVPRRDAREVAKAIVIMVGDGLAYGQAERAALQNR